MHTTVIVTSGLASLCVFVLIAHLINRRRTRNRVDGAGIFIWVWLAVSLLNMAIGVIRAGVPVTTELVVLIPVFGIPTGAAWFVSWR
jgi:hypothetical protein